MYVDNDRDYIPYTPEMGFVGYKCPFGQCDILQPSHDSCAAIRIRLDAIAGERLEYPGWFETFQWNISQWLLKNGYQSFDSIPS